MLDFYFRSNFIFLPSPIRSTFLEHNFRIKMFEIIAAIGLCTYLVSLQIPKTAATISASSFFFTALYGFLKQTRFLHPDAESGPKLQHHVEAEWRSRIVGTFHAVILTFGSIVCFLEWSRYLSPTHAWHVEERTPENEYYPLLLASIFLGYLQYDFLWLLYHRKTNFDAGSMIHHTLYIAITHYVLHGYYFSRAFAWLSFCEISTPCLHFRWFYLVRNKKSDPWYTIWSMIFAATFLFSRVFCYGLGLIDLWLARGEWKKLPLGFHLVVAGVHLGYVLNLFWARKVVLALKKNLPSRSNLLWKLTKKVN